MVLFGILIHPGGLVSEGTKPAEGATVEEPEVGSGTLEGIRCPKCGNIKCFHIEAVSTFRVVEDGTDGNGDVTWSPGSSCSCPYCLHDGTVAEFTGEAAPAPEMVLLPTAVEPCPEVVKARVKSIIYDAENSTSYSEEIGQLVRRLIELETL